MSNNMMQPMESFYEKLSNRLKNDIGELIPEDVLKALIDKVIQKEFFEGKENKNSFGKTVERIPSAFEGLIIKSITPVLEDLAKKAFEENNDKFMEYFKDVINNSLEKLLVKSIKNSLFSYLKEDKWSLVQILQNN